MVTWRSWHMRETLYYTVTMKIKVYNYMRIICESESTVKFLYRDCYDHLALNLYKLKFHIFTFIFHSITLLPSPK